MKFLTIDSRTLGATMHRHGKPFASGARGWEGRGPRPGMTGGNKPIPPKRERESQALPGLELQRVINSTLFTRDLIREEAAPFA